MPLDDVHIAQWMGETNGSIKALTQAVTDAKMISSQRADSLLAEINRRFETQHALFEQYRTEHGKRISELSRELKEHQLTCHRKEEKNWKKTTAIYGGTGVGGAGVWILIEQIAKMFQQ